MLRAGTCAMIQWLELAKGGWEFHFIEQYHKRQGDLKIKQYEDFVKVDYFISYS